MIYFAKISGCVLFLISILFSSKLTFQPNIYINSYSSGGDFTSKDINVAFLGWKVYSKYSFNNFQLLSSFSAHGIQNYQFNQKDLNNLKSIPYSNTYMDNYDNLWIYWLSEVAVAYKIKNKSIQFGNIGKNIGHSMNSIFLSKKPINYSSLNLNWEINSKLSFEYQYSFLNKNHIEINQNHFYNYKSLVYHGLKYQFNSKIQISLHETVTFDRNLDFNYLNPFIFYYPISRYIGFNDNIQIGLELSYSLNKDNKYFISVLIDEWDPDLTFDKYHENWIAYQFGGYLNNLLEYDELYFEYSWTDFRVYENKYEDVNFYLKGSSLGFWAGSHSECIFLNYQKNMKKLTLNFEYLKIKRGIQPENLIDIAYEKINFDRYSLGYEQKVKYTFKLGYQLNQLIDFGVSLNYLDWIIDSNLESKINSRIYFGLDLKYNFNQINL